MSDDRKAEQTGSTAGPDADRREALIKIGKYAAYTAPAMMMTVGTAHAGPPTPPVPTSTMAPPP